MAQAAQLSSHQIGSVSSSTLLPFLLQHPVVLPFSSTATVLYAHSLARLLVAAFLSSTNANANSLKLSTSRANAIPSLSLFLSFFLASWTGPLRPSLPYLTVARMSQMCHPRSVPHIRIFHISR